MKCFVEFQLISQPFTEGRLQVGLDVSTSKYSQKGLGGLGLYNYSMYFYVPIWIKKTPKGCTSIIPSTKYRYFFWIGTYIGYYGIAS